MGTGKCIFLLCTSCVVLQEKSEKERKQQENETESTRSKPIKTIINLELFGIYCLLIRFT